MRNRRGKFLGFIQNLGKSIMIPISVLPAAALLQRLGQADIWGTKLFNGNGIPWMVAAGDAVMEQMALLFAIGIAIGLAEDNNGSAGLAGAIGYFILTKVAYAFAIDIYPEIYTSGIFDLGIIPGVLIGIVAGILYNKYKEIELPQFLGFFGGKRFIPIVTSIVAIVVGLLLGMIWPSIQGWVNIFGDKVIGSGAIGAFVFGLFNRLLVPFGLHHVLNSMFWFQFGEYVDGAGVIWNGDIFRFLNGDTTAGAFQTGFYPIMMFALPAACLAMIVAAKSEKRKSVAGMLGGIALASFITGITEPIEFLFLFLSPMLYVIHALLTGISMGITVALGIRNGFSFSAGFIDYLLSFKLAEKPGLLIIIGILFGFIYFVLFYYSIKRFNIPTPGRENEEESINKSELVGIRTINRNNRLDILACKIADAVGGIDNIKYVDSCVTRVRMTLRDDKLINRSELKKLGASGIVKMGTNNIQIIIGTFADAIVSRIRKMKQ